MENGNYWSETESRQLARGEALDPSLGDPREIGRYRVIRRLGQGGFGRVYLGRDDDLNRAVAIKVPNPERVSGPGDVEAYLAEARALAMLDHPNIVPVYDVGRTNDGLCYVVSRYIEGSDLAERLRQGRPTFRESIELVAVVAGALHHAHTRGLVHRDVKPANILIGTAKEPWVADFGLALKDEDYGKGARLAGTPAYMSPEQARGEGHRVDGRSDIFSLGVVLYELLTGRKPFRGDSRTEVMDQIATAEPRPLRQIDDTIPRELERICQKAMAKRALERYSTGRDMADDLRHFLETDAASGSPAAFPSAVSPPPLSTQEATPPSAAPVRSDSDGRTVKIIPKGLRSFDRHDADFFLELLPGPRDREGLPDTIRFWKARIESTDPDSAFRVALIYGPSGCGKSSLVKAGLLPRLGKHVLPVYIEATPEETEPRLLKGMRKVCPDLPAGGNIVDALTVLRRGRLTRPGEKVLLVIDQFEQWLFARRDESNTELVAALRQCDGEHVQAIVMVRDDFWMAATRFMRDLEIRLVEGENSAAVDLFDLLHARRVLTALGRAYGVLPEKSSELSPEQRTFLEQSVAGLAEGGKVISVRLALFAEMVKGKPWTPATLKEVGGTQGVGVTFLDETFSATTAPPEHRLHQKAAQAILKALLPQSGTDIKGQMRSEAELREASGYASRPRDFDDVIGILDPELRLITPTDPEGSGGEVQSHRPGGLRYYQLTHDYLVHSLREWLTRKQRETRRGRAELRLAERAAIWDDKPENRHLPSIFEWASIRTLSRRKDWSESQRRMMRRAGRVHGLRAIGLAAVGALLVAMGLHVRKSVVAANEAKEEAAKSRVKQFLEADNATADIQRFIQEIEDDRRWADREFTRVLGDPLVNKKAKLNASLALLPVDPKQAIYLEPRLRDSDPGELAVLLDSLASHKADLTAKLWSDVEAAESASPALLPLATALARYDNGDPRWATLGDKAAKALVRVDPRVLDSWLDLLRPARDKLKAPLAAIFRGKNLAESERILAATSLKDYAADDTDLLADLLMDADPRAYSILFPAVEQKSKLTSPVFQKELTQPESSGNRPTIDPSWTKPDSAVVGRIESVHGLVGEQFALCQTMHLDEFLMTAEALRPSGYRPIRFRPFSDGGVVKVAAVWTRDRRNWRIESALSEEEVHQLDRKLRSEKFVPNDVAGYAADGADGKRRNRYAALWVEAADGEQVDFYAGKAADQETDIEDVFKDNGLNARTLQVMVDADGRAKYCGVWGRTLSDDVATQGTAGLFEKNFAAMRAEHADQAVVDVAISKQLGPRSITDRADAVRQRAEKTLQAKPGNLAARKSRALANLRLGETVKALADMTALIGARRDDLEILAFQAIAHARLRHKTEALDSLAKFNTEYAPQHSKLYLAAVVAAELNEEMDKAIAALDEAIAKQRDDAELRYESARAFALASKAVSARDPAKGHQLAARAIQRLQQAVEDQEADISRIDDDQAFDLIRDEPDFTEIMSTAHSERRYAAVWSAASSVESEVIAGLDPAGQVRRGRDLMAQGYRPVAWSVARTTDKGPLVAASVWHRTVVAEEAKDQLAERQARAAVALVRLGQADLVWPLLQHSPDPRRRSFIVNWLNPLGANPQDIAREFNHIDDGARAMPGPGLQVPRVVLYDPETSMRRALIQALGTYSADRLSPAQREPLIARLLKLYQRDPDAGIHGAAEWTLRQWKQQEKLKAIDDALELEHRGERRWFVNREGQTFGVIDGPAEFLMGSPGTEPQRTAELETARRIAIARRYAIATKEVTVEQFKNFLKVNDQFGIPPGILNECSPDPDGPWIGITWYGAAAYCNWLSAREGLREDQWCYIPNEAKAYAEGMTIPADVLERTGYRLATEAEWEYACRAGTVTSRYYGLSVGLLEKYARYLANSGNRAWPCGSLLPNDLGLFDMLGNVYEWTQDRDRTYRPVQKGLSKDDSVIDEIILDKYLRFSRGGAFAVAADGVRSAHRSGDLPTMASYLFGIRLARTCK